jgi:NAD(P)H-hydrate epimerase
VIPLLTADQMRRIDQTAIEGMKIPSLDLMEAAGRGVAEAMVRRLGRLEGCGVLVCCGRGNNGGDGFVVARRLKELGALPEVAVIGKLDDLSPDARVNAGRWEAAGGTVRFLDGDAEVEAFFDAPREVEMAVDALLGTGSRGAPRGPIARAIRGLNALDVPLVSIDIPSGIDADTGAVPGDAIEADLTVTLAFPKCGHHLYPARAHRGLLEIVDIGIPREAVLATPVVRFLVEPADVGGFLPRWPGDTHKGDRGRLLVVGGSVGLTGAVALASMAAARGGAGLVTAGVPAGLNDILEVKLTEAMTLPLAEGAGRWLSPAALPQIRDFDGGRLSAMVLGPGLSRNEEALELARLLVAGSACPTVVDADALYAFRGRSELLARAATGGPLVLTPHPGEAEWLLGRPAAEISAGRLDLAAGWAQEHGQVLVLKGAPTVIGSPEGETFVNPTGGPALATGGTGDVLAGLIGAFLAQGLSPLHAAIAGVFLHGFTADLIVEKRSHHGLVAGDLIEALPEAMGEVGRAG